MKRLLTLILTLTVVVSATATPKATKIKSPKGTTLTGVVRCLDKPIEGVAVSDGEKVVLTDRNGVYNICSTKPHKMVFITTPSGYQAQMIDNVRPGYWRRTIENPKKRERFDFELTAIDDSNFSVVMMSDTHHCMDPKKQDDKYFREWVMPALNKANADAQSAVFAVSLGDITWDRFWYANGFDIESVPQYLTSCNFPMPFYCVHGNHDYDPSVPATDNPNTNAIQRFCNTFGPTYYSINRGAVHFVFLDNIVYKNEVKEGQKSAKGVVGSRNYDLYVDNAQLEWLKNDLALVDKHTPIVVCMHAPLFTYNGSGEQVYSFTEEKSEKLVSLLKDFESVRIFSGHSHRTMSFVHPKYPNIVEYNVTSVGGDLWSTPAKYNMNIGEDGANAGFYLCTFKGKSFSKRWYSTSPSVDLPLRVYDMNRIGRMYAHSPILQKLCALQSRQTNYAEPQYRDYVYINCWIWEQGCKLTITENGKELTVEKVTDSDPFAASAIFAKSSLRDATKGSKKTDRLSISANMFRVKCSDSNTPLEISLTTPDGANYTFPYRR